MLTNLTSLYVKPWQSTPSYPSTWTSYSLNQLLQGQYFDLSNDYITNISINSSIGSYKSDVYGNNKPITYSVSFEMESNSFDPGGFKNFWLDVKSVNTTRGYSFICLCGKVVIWLDVFKEHISIIETYTSDELISYQIKFTTTTSIKQMDKLIVKPFNYASFSCELRHSVVNPTNLYIMFNNNTTRYYPIDNKKLEFDLPVTTLNGTTFTPNRTSVSLYDNGILKKTISFNSNVPGNVYNSNSIFDFRNV